MKKNISIADSSSNTAFPKHIVPFDFEASKLRIDQLREQDDLQGLIFQCGQAIIMASRKNLPQYPDALDIISRTLLIGFEEIDIEPIMLLLRAYPNARALIESYLNRLLAEEDRPSRPLLVAMMNIRVNRFGFLVMPKGEKIHFVDFLGMPYPLGQNGRPHINTVWIEATNHCNQKCSFCPDPKRESPRELTDLEKFKKRARDLHTSFDIGYWQLNAYGEPLLHPNLGEMIHFLRSELQSPAPVYFTTHGLTLTQPRIKKLLKALPNEVMISLHNDSEDSYAISRSEKIGDYQLLTDRVFDFCSALMEDSCPCSVRLSVLVNNAYASRQVGQDILNAFSDNPERFIALVSYWQERLRSWANQNHVQIGFPPLDKGQIAEIFNNASHGPDNIIVIAQWQTPSGPKSIFISPRPVGTYANLVPFQHDPDSVIGFVAASFGCGFTREPSLTIFANGRLGICCLDLETTASFGHADDEDTLQKSLKSEACNTMFANLAFGISDCGGCLICLGKVNPPSNLADKNDLGNTSTVPLVANMKEVA